MTASTLAPQLARAECDHEGLALGCCTRCCPCVHCGADRFDEAVADLVDAFDLPERSGYTGASNRDGVASLVDRWGVDEARRRLAQVHGAPGEPRRRIVIANRARSHPIERA